METDDLDTTAVRRVLTMQAHVEGHERAEAVYRSVAALRDLLPAAAQTQMAIAFEWARKGIAGQGVRSSELDALDAAYTYARDVMLVSARKKLPALTS